MNQAPTKRLIITGGLMNQAPTEKTIRCGFDESNPYITQPLFVFFNISPHSTIKGFG